MISVTHSGGEDVARQRAVEALVRSSVGTQVPARNYIDCVENDIKMNTP